MPDISVIIPAYREEKVIGGVVEKVRRVMDATGQSYEIIVVDDGSDDGTAAEAKKAGARVISHPYNIGNGAAVKTGIRQAKGKIFIMMDGAEPLEQDQRSDNGDATNAIEDNLPADLAEQHDHYLYGVPGIVRVCP